MIEIDNQGLGYGLNRRRKNNGQGTKVGNFLRKNARLRNVSIKNAVKVGKFAVPIATSFIPGAAATTKGLSLLSKAGKVGRFATKVAKSKAFTGALKFAKSQNPSSILTGLKTSLPATTTDYGEMQANFDAPIIQQGGHAVASFTPNYATSSEQNSYNEGNGVQSELLPVKEVASASNSQNKSESVLNTQPKDNTMLYIGGAVVLGGIIYAVTKK